MRKLTPIILALLMMVSTSLAVIDIAELDDSPMTNADGRTGPDAMVNEILSPKETTTDSITGEMRNTLKSGDAVNFEAFISNAGDTAIDEMGVSVTVYLAEDGARGMVAKDSSGNDLSWTNGDVVCDDTNVCPYLDLAAGANLANGKYTLNYQGAAIEWLPVTGDYVVVVEVSAGGDSDPGNDFQEILVSVTEWTDIVVDLSWDSGKEIEGGGGDKAFTLSVSTDGSTDWSARSITLALSITGTLTSATDGAGNDILGTTTVSGVGTSAVVETWRHEMDANNTTSDSRHTLATPDTWEYFGTVAPDTSGTSGDYSIEVNLVSYVLYGQMAECEETVERTSAAGDPIIETNVHFCEVTYLQDDVASTSEDELEGKVQTFHDIGVSSLVVNQGYQMDGDGNPMGQPSMPGLTEGPLNPSMSTVQASVRHLGSDMMQTYDWSVEFSITDISGNVYTEVADSCMNGFGQDYVHDLIGNDPMMPAVMEVGQACIFFDFAPGIYDISATASMVNTTVTDMSTSNDDAELNELIAMNNRPSVTLTLENDGAIIIGSESMVTLSADAIDADDDAGMTLRYVWDHPGLVDLQESPCTGDGPSFSQCMLMPVDSDWAGVHAYSVTVFDAYSSFASDSTNVFIWNHVVATAATGDFTMEYDLTYNGVNEFTIALAHDAADTHTKDLTAFGYAGEYTSEAVLDYSPVTTYGTEDVHAQSITISYDAAAMTPTSVFYVSPNGMWAMLDAAISTAGNDGTIDITLAAASPVLSGGEIALMGGELVVVSPPDATPTDLVVSASKGGHIDATWGYTGTLVSTIDYLKITVCDSAGNCDDKGTGTTDTVSLRLDGQTETTHGETYTVTLEICHQIAQHICNPVKAIESATADSGVDGDATADALTVSNKDDNTWTVSWTVDGDASDVDHWMVCFGDASWSVAGNMPSSNCVDAAAGATTADVGKPGADGMYHFTAVGVDAMGNHNNDVALNSMILERDTTDPDPCDTNPDSDECKDIGSAGSGEGVPGWTWGVIIGLVVVAFVVGAFILSRGGEGDEGKDWDY